jgi:polar amino acid transport system permease protein
VTSEAVPAPPALKVVPVRHPGRWAATAVVLVLVAMFVNTLLTNPRFQWDIVGEYFLSESVLDGLRRTLMLTVLSMLAGLVLGVVLAVMRLSPNPIVSSVSWLYIAFFRGTPLLVQLLFWFNLSALYPVLSLGVPFGPSFVSGSSNAFITPLIAALLGLALNEAAYMAEIVRGGLQSVDTGQSEAAQALGMSRGHILRRIVLPQAMRVIVPPTGNETISMLKTTSLVSVLSMPDLLYSVQIIYSRTYQTIPLLIVASLWYLILTSVLTTGQYFLERRFARGGTRTLPKTPWQRLTGALLIRHATPAGASGESR